MQAEEVEVDVIEVDPSDDILEGSAPLQPMQATQGRAVAVSRGSKIQREMRREGRLHSLMPYTLALSVGDVAQCEIVENEAFPPHERASHDKVRTITVHEIARYHDPSYLKLRNIILQFMFHIHIDFRNSFSLVLQELRDYHIIQAPLILDRCRSISSEIILWSRRIFSDIDLSFRWYQSRGTPRDTELMMPFWTDLDPSSSHVALQMCITQSNKDKRDINDIAPR